MATPRRPAKAGISWTFDELDAYKIRIKTVDIQEFFSISQLPAPAVAPEILQNVNISSLPNDICLFFRRLDDSTSKDPGDVDEFTFHILNDIMQFQGPRGITHTRTTFFFIMSGQRVRAVANLSLRRGEYQIILVQRDRTSRDRVEPRLVASALGAFSKDNDTRAANALAPLASKRYIGIITIASAHYFYKINITQALVDAVMNSQVPAQETIVERLIPPVPNVDYFLRDGMVPLDNRLACLQCYEAIRGLL